MKSILVLLSVVALVLCTETTSNKDSIVVSSSYLMDEELSMEESYRYISTTESNGEKNLSQLLATIPGVSTKENGGVGSYETISIRGVDGSRIALFVDGVPLNSSMGGAVDLSRFSSESLEGIEVYRGITPARLGGNSLGGAVNLITKKGSAESTRSLSLLLGSFGEFRGSAQLFEPFDSLSFRGFVDYHSSDNDYPYLDRSKTPDNPDEYEMTTLNNNRSQSFISQIGIDRDYSTVDLTIDWTHRSKTLGIPAAEGSINYTAESSEREDRIITRLDHAVKDFFMEHILSGVYNSNQIFWTGLDNFGVPHATLSGDDWALLKSTTITGEYQLMYSGMIGSQLYLNGRASGRYEQMIPSSETSVDGFGEWESDRLSGGNATDVSLYIGDATAILGGSFTAHQSSTEGGTNRFTAIDLDPQSTLDIDWSSRLGINRFFNNGDGNLFINGAIYSKIPTLRQLYGYTGTILPNPDLEREQGATSELGVSHSGDKVSTELVLFYNHFDNLITTIFDGRMAKAINIGESRNIGVEQTLFGQLSSHFSIHEAVTFQKPTNLTPPYEGNLLPNQSEFSIFTDLVYEPIPEILISVQSTFESLLFRDRANRKAFPSNEGSRGRFNMSLFASWEKEWLTLSGGIQNIFDGRTHNDSRYTLESDYYRTLYPGRVVHIEAKFTF